MVGAQAAVRRVWDATYFGSPFSLPANGSSGSVTLGQSREKLA